MQTVRFTTSDDGTSLAWARSGAGIPLVKPANWLTHLEFDRQSPVWAHWIEFFETHFDFVRFDERGCGLSDRKVRNLSIDYWVQDLEAVIKAAEISEPFILLGISQGAATAIEYAAQHPDRVKALVLYGGYARGSNRRDDPATAEVYKTIVDVFRLGWDQNNPAFQDVFTSRFIPGGSQEHRRWYTELCQKVLSPENGAELLMARAEVDVESSLAKVTVPTLVIHARNDNVVPSDEGLLLAKGIPDSQLKILDGRNHILQKEEPAWRMFKAALLEFTLDHQEQTLDELTKREREVLRGICRAESNKQIALNLGVSEKTVRNHASHLFAKLGLESRQQAIRDFGRMFV